MNPNDMAFPTNPEWTPNNTIQCGLTKLEYGALQIAAAMCTTGSGGAWPSAGDRHEIARRSVAIAAAVLAEANR